MKLGKSGRRPSEASGTAVTIRTSLRHVVMVVDDPWAACTVRVKIITGSLAILASLFPPNHRYRYRLEIRMNYHYRYRLGARSHPFISIDLPITV